MIYRSITYILFMILFIFLGACGGMSLKGDILPDFGGLDSDPTRPRGEDTETPSYENGAGVYLDNIHDDLSSYEKVHFYADLGDVAGSQGTSNERQGGSIVLTFEDHRGQKANRIFSTGGSTYASLENNFWTRSSSESLMWRGIFQGRYGALIMIVDDVFMSGDGAGPEDTMGGSIWFRRWQVLSEQKLNFHDCVLNSQGLWDCKNQSAPIRQCWYISRGPYDCRFKIHPDGQLVTRLANYSNDTDWIKLGTFNDLNKSKTFHETY